MTKISLVTGASRGLGRNTARSIARQGGDVVITYRSRGEDAQAAVAEITALGARRSPSSSIPAMSPPSPLSSTACGLRCARPGSVTPSITW